MRSPMLRDRRAVRFLDGAIVVWSAAWIVLGVIVGLDVDRISRLSDTVSLAATTLDTVGSALGEVAKVPFVGTQLGSLAEQVRQTAASTHQSAFASRHALHQLAIVLGLAVGLVPTLPLLVLYTPLRLGWRRDVLSVRRAQAKLGDDPAFREFLARRAVDNLPYRVLLQISDNPWRDLRESRTDALARAELTRLGIVSEPNGR